MYFLVADFLFDELSELVALLTVGKYLHKAAFMKEIQFWACLCIVNCGSFMIVIYY